jgi:hypothetical protein
MRRAVKPRSARNCRRSDFQHPPGWCIPACPSCDTADPQHQPPEPVMLLKTIPVKCERHASARPPTAQTNEPPGPSYNHTDSCTLRLFAAAALIPLLQAAVATNPQPRPAAAEVKFIKVEAPPFRLSVNMSHIAATARAGAARVEGVLLKRHHGAYVKQGICSVRSILTITRRR